MIVVAPALAAAEAALRWWAPCRGGAFRAAAAAVSYRRPVGGDQARHPRPVGITVRQAVTAVDHEIPAADQVGQPRMRTHTGVDDRHRHPGAAAELPRLGQVEHVHVLGLHPIVGVGHGGHPRAVGALTHLLRRAGRPVRGHRARVDTRGLDRGRRRCAAQRRQAHQRAHRPDRCAGAQRAGCGCIIIGT